MKKGIRGGLIGIVVWVFLFVFACTDVRAADALSVLSWSISEGQVTISGCDTTASGVLEIPSSIEGHPVTTIGGRAFLECSGLTSITLPVGLTSIGESAFYYCTGLTNIILPEGATSIGKGAFFGCEGLTSITLPAGVTSIADWAFLGCVGLTSISLPAGVTSIGDAAFLDCYRLTSISLPAGLTSIGDYAFSGCRGLTSTSLPEGLTSIGYAAFELCSGLTSVTIPENVTSIASSTFTLCSGLTNISLPEGVTSIGVAAFANCYGLMSITIPEGVTYIDRSAFWYCTGLTNIILPEGVTSISSRTFYGCSGLTSITIPEGVTSIGDAAFLLCSGLTSATFTGDAPASFIGNVFEGAASGFSVYYYEGAEGFSTPTWYGYPCEVLVSDVDLDGIPDWWESQYFGGATNAHPAVLCSNGINTRLEAYVAGLDPLDPDARLVLDGMGDTLWWNGVSGRVYSVWWSTNLVSGFQVLETDIPWAVGGLTNGDPSAEGQLFYQLKVELE